MTESKTAFAYLRISTDKQDEGMQKLQIENYAKTHGVIVPEYGWFIDEVSGAKVPPLERPGFKDLYESIQELKTEDPDDAPKNVLVYEISRLGRDLWESLDLIRPLEDRCPIVSTSPKESFMEMTDRSLRQFLLVIFAWAAERERSYIVQRVNDGVKRAKSENRHFGNVPLGYEQHVCRDSGGELCLIGGKPFSVKLGNIGQRKCEDHGWLFLNDPGKQVYDMLKLNPKTPPRAVMAALNISDYHQAYKIIRSVKKFGLGSNDPINAQTTNNATT